MSRVQDARTVVWGEMVKHNANSREINTLPFQWTGDLPSQFTDLLFIKTTIIPFHFNHLILHHNWAIFLELIKWFGASYLKLSSGMWLQHVKLANLTCNCKMRICIVYLSLKCHSFHSIISKCDLALLKSSLFKILFLDSKLNAELKRK